MKTARLIRSPSTDQGTFGVLEIGGRCWYSGELPWRDNAKGRSCIPIGTYRVEWAPSPRLKRSTYRVLGVPGRDGVLLHSANLMGDVDRGFVAQLEGCISLGKARGRIQGQSALLLSKPALREFEALLAGEPFELEVRNA